MPDLVMGTAQWGSHYGITNFHGQLSVTDVQAFVELAAAAGVGALDTALGYGDAQARIEPYADRFWVSTKVAGTGDVSEQIGMCLEQLQVNSLDAVMLHDWDVLDEEVRLRAVGVLSELALDGVIERIGVSTYGESGVDMAVDVFASSDSTLGIVQVPANAIDRRLESAASLEGLRAQGCVVQVRSVLLQGLLASPDGGELGSHPDAAKFRAWASTQPGGPVGAALAHVRSLPWVSQVVVGASSVSEWTEVCSAWREVQPQRAPEHLASRDEVLLDPRRWV